MATEGTSQRTHRLTARGAVTRARIVEAAADIVYARGAGGTSLDDVMAASATSKSQLYHYFADKDALIREVIALQTRRVLEAQQPQLGGLDSLAGLRRWSDVVVELNRSATGGCPIGSLASELAERSELARELLADGFQAWEGHLVAGLEAMRERGELVDDASPGDLATAIMTALQGGILLAQTTRTVRPLELGLEMALEHVAGYVTRRAGGTARAHATRDRGLRADPDHARERLGGDPSKTIDLASPAAPATFTLGG